MPDDKELINARCDTANVERVRNAVFWIGQGLTFAGVVSRGLELAAQELEKEHNDGQPFRQRTRELPKSKKKLAPAARGKSKTDDKT